MKTIEQRRDELEAQYASGEISEDEYYEISDRLRKRSLSIDGMRLVHSLFR